LQTHGSASVPEQLALAAMRPVLTDRYRDWVPDVFVNCHSSAAVGGPNFTRELATKAALANVASYSFDSEAGVEIAQSLLCLHRWNKR
jgi:hypothetical protein